MQPLNHTTMKRHPSFTPVCLHRLTDQLIKGLIPRAIENGSLIINDIDREMVVQTDENMLAYILCNLLNGIVCHTREESIHIGADIKGDCTGISVGGAGSSFYHSVTDGLLQLQQVAEKLGGSISIEMTRARGTVVSISLFNELEMA